VKHGIWLIAIWGVVGWNAALADDQPAGESGADGAALFTKLDTNQDGKLTASEVPEAHKRLFERLVRLADADGDGSLVLAEFTAGLKPGDRSDDETPPSRPRRDDRPNQGKPKPDLQSMVKRLDRNGDGRVTPDEVPEKRKEQFQRLLARLDRNGDKELAMDELERLPGTPAEPGAAEKPAATPTDSPKKEKGKGKPGQNGNPQRFFSRFDKNGDGKLTADEAPAERPQFFEQLVARGDKDGDQAVSLAEFVAVGRERMKKGGAPQGLPPGGKGMPPSGLFKVFDADGDGKLSSGEISSASDALRKLDRDGDGEVSARELAAGLRNKND